MKKEKISEDSLNKFPFSGSLYFDNNEIENISNYLQDNKKTKLLENLNLLNIEKEENYISVFVKNLNNEKIEKISFYRNPVILSIDELIKERKIYTVKQCVSILTTLNSFNYSIKVNEKIYDKNNFNKYEIESIKGEINKKLEIEEFSNYIYRNKDEFNLELGVKEIKKERISFYFDEICLSNKARKCGIFDLIIDENRKNFINKIKIFLNSNNLFYFILGNDGIGKTVSLLYYSSMVNEYRTLYLNLKLLLKKNKEEIEDIFFNEIKRIFITCI